MPPVSKDADRREIENYYLHHNHGPFVVVFVNTKPTIMKKESKKPSKKESPSTGEKDIENNDSAKAAKPGDQYAYPADQDIYSNELELDVDPEDPEQIVSANEKPGLRNEKNFEDDVSGSDLDIPGAELDDDDENAGREDEENNGYSLGGDDHDDLEEDRGE
jgi:hypothetical protein